jgi:hypothetical protein
LFDPHFARGKETHETRGQKYKAKSLWSCALDVGEKIGSAHYYLVAPASAKTWPSTMANCADLFENVRYWSEEISVASDLDNRLVNQLFES